MTTPVLVAGPGTPYVTPEVLRNATTGVAWGTIPRKDSSDAERLAEQTNICWRATGDADATYCRQVLRATVNTDQYPGPGTTRVNIDQFTGNCVVTVPRWPVLQVLAVQVSPNRFPRAWTPVPAGMFGPASTAGTVYGTSAPSNAGEGTSQIVIAPGWVSRGRGQTLVQITYINGWPHAGTSTSTQAAVTELPVDDCTGWAPPEIGAQGAAGMILDGARQEFVTCLSASADQGPGTLTLAAPLAYGHRPGIIITTLPPQVQEGVILLSVAEALERGATATTHMQMPGSQTSAGISDQEAARQMAARKLQPFARII